MTEHDLDALPEGYSVTTTDGENREDSVVLQTKYETLLYTPEGAQQLGCALIEEGEKLEEQQDGTDD